MSTSGNTSFELTRDDIINSMFRKLGMSGYIPTTSQISDASMALNSMIQLFHTLGMPLWKRVQTPITLVSTQQTYTIPNAVKVLDVYLITALSENQYSLVEKSLYDFLALPTSSGSVPVHWYGQPKIQDFTIGVWPTPDTTTPSTYSLLVVSQKEFDGFTSGTETPDFPPYWTDALIYGGAVRIAPEYGIPLMDRSALEKQAKEYLELALGYGDEDGSLYIQPDRGC